MEVRQRRKNTSQSNGSNFKEEYSSENNYGFGKPSKRAYEERKDTVMTQQLMATDATAEDKDRYKRDAVNRSDYYMDEPDVQYPDNIGTFADGLKGDIFELFETGAKVLNKSFKLLLPFGSETSSQSADVLRELEIRSPLANVTNKTRYRSQQVANMSSAKSPFKAAEDAIRMRCSSMWKKENPLNGACEPFLPMPSKNLFPQHADPGGGQSKIRVTEGAKVRLNKLNTGNGSIQNFDCCDETILLVGNQRLILASRNYDDRNTGTVVWSQTLHDIDSCTITFNSNPTLTSPTKVHLELSIHGGKLVRKVSMPNTLVCSQALQVIQDRRVKTTRAIAEMEAAAKATTSTLSSLSAGKEEENRKESTAQQSDTENGDYGQGSSRAGSNSSSGPFSNSSDELAASISAVIAATGGNISGRGGGSVIGAGLSAVSIQDITAALTPSGQAPQGKGVTTSNASKKSPELIAADALIADITAILNNLELAKGNPPGYKGQGGSGNGGGPGHGVGGVGGSDSHSGFTGGDSEIYASPLKRVCYDHGDKDFGDSVLCKGDFSPTVGLSLNFTPNGNKSGASFSHGHSSPLSGSAAGRTPPSRRKHRKGQHMCRGDHRHGHSREGGPGVSCNHPECMRLHAAVGSDSILNSTMGGEGSYSSCTHGHGHGGNGGGITGGIISVTDGNGTGVYEASALSAASETIAGGHFTGASIGGGEAVSNQAMPNIDKFRKMVSMGVPLGAVQQKMQKEGVDPELLNSAAPVVDSRPESSDLSVEPVIDTKHEPAPAVSARSPEEEKAVEKYQKMLKAGVPLEAVKHKMKAEGLDPALLDGPKPKPVIDEAKLRKFKMMLKAGVEVAAVLAKMSQEGFSKEEQAHVTGASSDASGAPVPALPAPAAPNKLIALHWDPMSNTDLQGSIWGKLQGSNQIKGLEEGEMEKLAAMFGKKEPNAKKSVEETKPDEKSGGPPKLKVIDTTRAMNVSIGLTSFKSQGITIDQIGSALDVLDTKFLGIDCLLRIKELLPNDTEQKGLQLFDVDNGHPAEICLFKLSQVSRFRIKVESMIFMNTMHVNGCHLTSSLITLREVAGRILMSEGLREIMVSVLAIGNAMNQGNWKGSAMGFKLGSLIKLAQTKSTDGKQTLIDYLIIVLHERAKGGSAVCETALDIDEELALVKKSKHLSLSEMTKDSNTLQKDAECSNTESKAVIDKLQAQLASGVIAEGEDMEKAKASIEALQAFQIESTALVASVTQSLAETNGKFKELATFFGEDAANVGSILGTISEFIDHFSAAKHTFNRKNRKRPL